MTRHPNNWPPSHVVVQRGAMAALVLILLMLALLLAARFGLLPNAHAAGLTGKYVQLLAVTGDGRVSVVHDLTAAECEQIIARVRILALGWAELSCLPIDYNQENKRR